MREIVVILTAFLALACTKNPIDQPEAQAAGLALDRQVMLTRIADSLVIPAYEQAIPVLKQLQGSAAAFAYQPSLSQLQDLRSQFVTAYTAWQAIELLDFGPANERVLKQYCNIYPASVSGINENIAAENPNLNLPSSYTRQGFPAIDYLIYGTASTDTEVLQWFTDIQQGEKRRLYLSRIAELLVERTEEVLSLWRNSYRSNFIGSTGLENGSSTNVMVNALIMHYERFIRSGKIGIPSGVMQNGVLSPEKVEGYYSKVYSKQLMLAAHSAFRRFIAGSRPGTEEGGFGISTYLASLNAELSADLLQQFTACETKISLLEDDFSAQLTRGTEPFLAAYLEMQTAIKLMKVDMTSAMGTSITYADNDGD
ncbi:MAG TPA: imelysin family protein [Luteibaculaceae bacterium]|nr:imelysin family protein [Luteibaculaceae bacterium]